MSSSRAETATSLRCGPEGQQSAGFGVLSLGHRELAAVLSALNEVANKAQKDLRKPGLHPDIAARVEDRLRNLRSAARKIEATQSEKVRAKARDLRHQRAGAIMNPKFPGYRELAGGEGRVPSSTTEASQSPGTPPKLLTEPQHDR